MRQRGVGFPLWTRRGRSVVGLSVLRGVLTGQTGRAAFREHRDAMLVVRAIKFLELALEVIHDHQDAPMPRPNMDEVPRSKPVAHELYASLLSQPWVPPHHLFLHAGLPFSQFSKVQ